MCLALPLKLESVDKKNKKGIARTSSGSKLEVALNLVQEAEEGEWVLVHGGIALEIVTEEKAKDNLEAVKDVIERF